MGCGLTLPLMVTGSLRDTLRRRFLRLEKGEAEEQMLFVPVPHVHACPQNYLQRVPMYAHDLLCVSESFLYTQSGSLGRLGT